MNKKIEKSGLILGIIVIIVLIILGMWWSQRTIDNSLPTTVGTSTNTLTPVSTTTSKTSISVEKKTNQSVDSIIASLPDTSSFSSYFVSTGVSDLLTGKGPYTVFVPVNGAFAHIPTGTISNLDTAGKKRFVEYHIVPNRAIDVDALSFGTIQALSRDMLNFSANQAGEPQVNSAFVLHAYQATNGIVYLVSEALLPPKK